jgi:ribonucleoside-triphosphate reductase
MIGINRLLMIDKITKMFSKELAEEYIRQLESHEIYKHDETSLNPYCVSITMYPFLFDGMEGLGGVSSAPKNLTSFTGSFINLVFAVAAQFAGAVSTPEFLTYMDYFVRREYGDEYYKNPDKKVVMNAKGSTINDLVEAGFQQVVYSLNSPAAARNMQSVFWNIAYFDKPYFEGIFKEFYFPDGTSPQWESVNWLQKRFMKWFNKERLKKILTFPVETVNLLDNGTDYVDQEWKDFTAEMWAEGHSFFLYRSGSVDSLSSCCRLRNEIQENTFSFTLGAGGVSTGSKGVITININRLVQNAHRGAGDVSRAVDEQVKKIHKYLMAFNEIMLDNLKSKLLRVYDAGFISMNKQYLTIGINGFIEGAEFLGIEITPNDDYFEYGEMILKPIYEANRVARTSELMFNTEFVPAENLGVKYAKWDKEDGYFSPRDCYNSYFYRVETHDTTIIDKFMLHGGRLTKYLDGGSALHCNLDEHLSKPQYLKMLDVMLKTGCSYATFNIPNTRCNTCGHISKHKLYKCEKCGGTDLDWATRIIGYLKFVSSFSEPRQQEESRRLYADGRTQIQ